MLRRKSYVEIAIRFGRESSGYYYEIFRGDMKSCGYVINIFLWEPRIEEIGGLKNKRKSIQIIIIVSNFAVECFSYITFHPT